MDKMAQLKLLERIEELLRTADADSYIASTFAGISEVCRNNIVNDFGDEPVRDLDDLREKYYAEVRSHDATKRQLADAQKALKESLDLNNKLQKTADEWEQNAHDAGEMYCGLEEEIKEQNAEIVRLRAEIVRMRFYNLTREETASLYEVIKECGK